MSKICYIYGLVDPRTDEIRYVGKSIDPWKRLKSHIKETSYKEKKNYHSKCWIKQLLNEGLEPNLVIIEECNENNWQEREMFWIQHYGYNNLTNLTLGGEGHKVPYYRPQIKQRIKIDVYYFGGEFYKTFNSLTEASNELNIHTGKISGVCKQKIGRNSIGGYVFRYHGEPYSYKPRFARKILQKKLVVLDRNWNFIKEYDHAELVVKELGIPRYTIVQHCLKYERRKEIASKTSYPYIFIYKKDYEDIVRSSEKSETEANDHALCKI